MRASVHNCIPIEQVIESLRWFCRKGSAEPTELERIERAIRRARVRALLALRSSCVTFDFSKEIRDAERKYPRRRRAEQLGTDDLLNIAELKFADRPRRLRALRRRHSDYLVKLLKEIERDDANHDSDPDGQ